MATYALDFYGRAFYGTSIGVNYSVAPFTVSEHEYGRLILQWMNATGDWTFFRLVKNISGFPANQNDGEILLDLNRDVDGAPPSQYDDQECVPGKFYYYSIFVGVGVDAGTATWWRAGTAMNMATSDLGWTDRYWSWIPEWYRRGDDSKVITDPSYSENYELKRFLDIFGYQMNVLGSQGNALLDVNNAETVSFQAISQLGAELGVDVEPELGARITRTRVKNAVYLNQLKGTTTGLAALISASTGWSSTITESPNRMLDDDQASFVHPTYPAWSPYFNYTIGERVAFNANYYQAAVANFNQSPPTTRTNNTYWTYVGDSQAVFPNPRTKGPSTWGVYYSSTGQFATNPSVNNDVRLSVGIQSSSDSTVYASNALIVTNKSGSTSDLIVSSVSPIIALAWSSATTYVMDNYVTISGKTYRSLQNNNLNHNPTTSPTYWKVSQRAIAPNLDVQQAISDGVPIDAPNKGLVHCGSAYVMNHATSPSGTAAFSSIMLQWYDEYGFAVGFVQPNLGVTAFDDFSTGILGSNINSQPAIDGSSWTSQPAIARSGIGYVYLNTTTPGIYTSLNSVTVANALIAVTVRRFAVTGGSGVISNGIVFRWSDANNYWRLGQNKLVKVVAGVASTVFDLTTSTPGAFIDGDRMIVQANGSSIKVTKNTTLVTTVTDSFNSTAAQHGLWVQY